MTSASKENFKASGFGQPLDFKLLADDATGEISGYGAIFDNVDLQGDTISPGAFQSSLAEHRAQGTRPAMLWSHDLSKPIGTWNSISEDSKGLAVNGKLNLDVHQGREAHALLKSNSIRGLSIGYQADPRLTAYDRTAGTRMLKGVRLHEISLVSIPANPLASIDQVKSLDSPRDLEEFLRSHGFAKSAAKAIAAGGWPALAHSSVKALPPTILAAVKAATLDLKGLAK